MKKSLKLFLFLGLLLMFHFGAMETLGQGVCVIAEQKVSKIAGSVKFLNSESFIKDAKLKLTARSDQTKVISETITNERGLFEFENIAKGKYMLIVSNPNLITLYIPLKVSNKKKDSKLQVSLGALIGEPCGGGDVKTISQ
ncbi:MAG: hypothetical protein D6735_08995 [Acidobacteria bacterium]|jgi:hypothetical protein|nr:MAG: hypothetical protein D6735_08995 [Acidobacteriota bacterium]